MQPDQIKTLADRMEEIVRPPYDPEEAHGRAEDLLCEMVLALAALHPSTEPAARRAVDAFKRGEFWYA